MQYCQNHNTSTWILIYGKLLYQIKALDKSINILTGAKFRFIFLTFLSIKFSVSISVDKFDLNPYCCGQNRLLVLK